MRRPETAGCDARSSSNAGSDMTPAGSSPASTGSDHRSAAPRARITPEDEPDPLGGELVDGLTGEPGEDPPALVVGVGGSGDRAHGPHHASWPFQLPAQEGAEPYDVPVVDRHPARRGPERVLLVLPGEERCEPLVAAPSEAGTEQGQHRRVVAGRDLTDEQLRRSHPCGVAQR